MRVDFLENFSFATNFLEMWSYLSFSLITTSKSFFNNAKIITLHYSTSRIVIFSFLFHASWNFHQRNLINLNDEDENFLFINISLLFLFFPSLYRKNIERLTQYKRKQTKEWEEPFCFFNKSSAVRSFDFRLINFMISPRTRWNTRS